jgi:hypothetical protein
MNLKKQIALSFALALTNAPAFAASSVVAGGGSNTTGVTQQQTASNNVSSGYQSRAGSTVGGPYSVNETALGAGATAGTGYSGQAETAAGATALGANAHAQNGGAALGYGASANSQNSLALGTQASAGSNTNPTGTQNAVAVGYQAISTGQNSVALGAGSNDEGAANTVSIGNTTTGLTRTLTGLAPGAVSSTSVDAVNGAQLYDVQQTAQSAQSTATSAQNTASSAARTAQTAQTVAGNAQSAAAQAQSTAGQALTIANNSAQYSTPGALGLNTNNGAGTLVQNVAAGQAATDAANVGQVQAAAAGAVTTANSYTSQQINALQTLINSATSSGLCKYSSAGGIVCGNNTTAAAGAVAQGDGASAGYAGALAIGQGATITAPTSADGNTVGAIAIGQGASANADPATALGYQASAAGADSVAVGANSAAQGANSVALGSGSVANRANSVSVGNAATGMNRQITNVAPATQPTDAPNLSQVQGLIGQATSGVLAQANQHADEVAAMAAATSMTPQFGPKGYSLTAAVAGVGSQNAVGIGFARAFQFHDHPAYWQASVGFNGGSGTAAVKIGGSIGW